MQSHRGTNRMHSVGWPGKIIGFAAACGSRRPTLPKCFLGIVPQFGHHRLQMTFEEGAAVPSHAAAIRARIHDLKAKHLQIFQLRVPWYKAWDRIRCCPQDPAGSTEKYSEEDRNTSGNQRRCLRGLDR
jgi:hypothetical protein